MESFRPQANRNIDKVVLGKLCFRTWYPSHYGKETLGEGQSSTLGKAGGQTAGDAAAANDVTNRAASKKDRDRDHHPPRLLERLYVCPACFKYSKELVPWWGHVKLCEKKGYVPGRKIYVHPKGRRRAVMPVEGGLGPGQRKKRVESGARQAEIVQDEGEWSIWEVDGEHGGVSNS